MTNRVIPLLALALLASAVVGLAADKETTLYVATNGKDAWSGKLPAPNPARTDGPLASIVGARDAIRKMKAAGPLAAPVRVLIRGGEYRLPDTVTFGPEDSGTVARPITYAAYPGEKPGLSGGDLVTGWTRRADGTWTARLPGLKERPNLPRAFFVDGGRRGLARTPNTGYFRMAGKGAIDKDPVSGAKVDSGKQAFRYKPEDLKGHKDLAGGNIVAMFWWETGHLPISGVDEATDTMVLTGEMKWPFWADQRYYLENTFDSLDAPGEWYVREADETLYYKPLPGEQPGKVTAVLPRLTQLVVLQGKPDEGKYVDDLRFEGLALRYADYPLEPKGHSDWQAAVTIPAVFHANGARRCVLEGCEISHIGSYGVYFERGCKSNRVVRCELTDLGAGGVRIGEGGNPPNEAVQTTGNTVSNCFIHDIGVIYAGAIGVWIGQSSDNTISHNEICDTNYSAVSVGWTWGYGPTTAHRNTIEYNHLHHLARGVLGDMGAIYTLGTSPGTVERNNLIHDVWCFGYGGGGIYPDEGSSEILIENNVVYNTISGGLTLHYGKNNTVRNNIFAFGRDQQIVRGRDEEHVAFNFTNNIVYFDTGRVWSAGGSHRNWTADYNCYWDTSGTPLRFVADMSLEEWRKLGFDEHSINAGPGFVNAKARDFRLRPDSPALKLGFKPIDVSKAGLFGPKEWVEKPKKLKHVEGNFAPEPPPPPKSIDDDFERTPLGAQADGCVTYGETAEATIRVTDESAATGKRSLKFTDAPGLDQPWNPHLWFVPSYFEGLARLQFDLRLEPGALFWHEWRDAANPYNVGPSLGTDATGQLTATGQKVAVLPANAWVHFEIRCGLGKASTQNYDLAVTAPGAPPVRLEKLACGARFKALEWLGFISNSTDKRSFYLDNLKLELVKP